MVTKKYIPPAGLMFSGGLLIGLVQTPEIMPVAIVLAAVSAVLIFRIVPQRIIAGFLVGGMNTVFGGSGVLLGAVLRRFTFR